jgi:hypothetical protein
MLLSTGAALAGAPVSNAPSSPNVSSMRAAAPPASGCVVVLDCDGVTRKTLANAQGQFTFRDVPAGTCTVRAMDGTVMSPRDAASGLPTGKRQHKPMTFVITLDDRVAQERTATVDSAPPDVVSFTNTERRKEFKGHVTLMK